MGRLVDDLRQFGLFGNKKNKFHLELRCSNPSISNTQLCGKCHSRPRELGKYHSALLHGLIHEPIPPWSHIFGGEWYESKVATYGQPEEAEMVKGKKAQLEATRGVLAPPPATASAPVTIPETQVAAETPKPTKRLAKAKTVTVSTASTAETPTVVPKKKPGRPKKNETVTPVPVVAPSEPVEVPTLAIESNETALDDKEIIKVVVRAFEHNGHKYFLDARKNKLYTVGPKDKRPSRYHGRWNPETQTIHTDFPDSDVD